MAPWRLTLLLALAAMASGILLTGVSVWFLGAVAIAGLGPVAAALTFNFHTPAALVRLFALSKTVCKYGERVFGHRAALLDQVRRRSTLFAAMAHAPSTRAVGWQLGNQDRLSDYMEDVEDVDYARLRVALPALALMAGTTVMVGATTWLATAALIPIAALSTIVVMMLRRAMHVVSDHRTAVRFSQRGTGRVLGAALAAVVPLKAERALAKVLAAAFAGFSAAAGQQAAQRRELALLDMVAGLAGPVAALSVLAAAWHAGSRGSVLLVPAFLAFGWLTLGETVLGISRIVLGRVRELAASEGLQRWTAASGADGVSLSLAALQRLVLTNVPRQTPDGRGLGEPVNLTLEAGRPTVLIGASGAGKTTLLKQVAGWIGDDDVGRYTGDGVVLLAARRRAMSHLCLHDAAILSDTIRENLFASNAADSECWEALAAVELDSRIAAAGGLDAWIEQDMLSLGEAQRLNLARALFSEAPLVLLDEPVEHLDAEQGSRILKRVLRQLADHVVVYSSHDAQAAPNSFQLT
ncbi:MAG: ATP-binding cassette domain-containing protein [Xanthobacteraceae bacterium]|jgi:ABC-type transport system involved in cytochrome bd biosynthesis fused ATPase/permease subunit